MLDVVMPLSNGTRPKNYPMPEDFGVDYEKYYPYIFIYDATTISINFTLVISIDTMYVVYVQHACGIFYAIG